MTIQGGTICNIIQAFPVLLILAQNSNKCLHTPFVYKPPSPTHSPEYYEAYETLLHALLNDNHGCHGYQYGIPYAYGKKYPQFKNLCYNFQPSVYNRYPPIHGYASHGHMTYGYPDSNGDSYYPSLGDGHGYSYYGSKSANGVNTTKYVYKSNYAPNQSHVRRKYKVRTAEGRMHGRSQKIQGFFPREERRFQPQYGFAQNFVPSINRLRNTLNNILHPQSQNPNVNQNQYDQYASSYPNNRPNNVRFPNQGQSIDRPYNNFNRPNYQEPNRRPYDIPRDEEKGYGFENGANSDQLITNAPEITGPNRPYKNNPIINGQQNKPAFGKDATNGPISGVQNGPAFGKDATNGPISGGQNGPAFGKDATNGPIVSGAQNGPAFGNDGTSGTIVSGVQNEPAFGNDGTSGSIVSGVQNGPAFGNDGTSGTIVSGVQNGPAFGNDGTSGSIFSGVQNGPAFGNDGTSGSIFSGVQNGPAFGNDGTSGSIFSGVQNGPAFGNDGTSGSIVSGVQNGPTFGNEASNGLITGSVQNLPAFPQNNSSTKAPTFVKPKPAIPDEEPVSTTTSLPILTPVPDSESRNNFNFGSAGIFQETCTTIDNNVGSCINIKFCEPYVKLLEQSKTNSAAVQVLRKAHCGFDGSTPKVCCPRPGIPDEPPPEVPTQQPDPVTPAPADTASGKSLGTDFIAAFPSPPECGLSNASFGRVVGGIDAQLGDFPWMALLGYQGKRNPTTSWLCGGSLITHHHVLTAAHCIHNHEVDLYVVRVGELDLAREDDGATPVDVLIKDKVKHEDYNPKAYTNDIGLLVLQKDVQFTDLIRPICIPMDAKLRTTNFEDYMPFIAGWGDLEFRGPKATRLQVLQLPVVSNDYCRQAYTAYKAQVIDERVLCAGFKKGGKDSCQGDSGGPLMQPIYNFENATTYIYQIGVVSFGKKCAEPGFPGVYSRVTNFVPWLEEKVLGIASTN